MYGKMNICKCSWKESGLDLVYGMIIARVVLGDTHVCLEYSEEKYKGLDKNRPVRRPPLKDEETGRLFDSVLGESIANGGNTLKYREVIVYDQAQAYPEYIVYYQRVPLMPGFSLEKK